MGAFERGARLSQRAPELNPLNPAWYYFAKVRWHYDAERYEEALADVQKAGMPDLHWSHIFGVAANGQIGHADAGAALVRLFAIKPDLSPAVELKKWNAAPADQDHVLEGLRKAGLAV